MNKKLIDKIVDKLIKSMMPAEIINYKNSIWFIDREKQFWFFEFDTSTKHLWWRWSHFTSELKIFSLEEDGESSRGIFIELFSKIINRKKFIESKYGVNLLTVSDVMNFSIEDKEKIEDKPKVGTGTREVPRVGMDEVLNQEVEMVTMKGGTECDLVEEVLNHRDVVVSHGEMIDEENFLKGILEALPDPSNNQARIDGVLKNT